LAASECGIDLADADRMAQLAASIRVELTDDRVLLDGRDVTQAIRKFGIATATHYAADNPAVRSQLVLWQRAAAEGADVVTEGRDQGTVVFPHAECKIFLTADEHERAHRRHRDLAARGEDIPFEEVLANQQLRDQRDASRAVGALRKADDAIEVSTDGLTPDEVITRLEQIVRSKL
jgi:cytidylate kinase